MHSTLFTTALITALSLAGTLIGTNGAPAAIAQFHGLQSRGIGGSPGKGGKGGSKGGSKGGGGALDEFPGLPGGAASGASGGPSWGQAAQAGTKSIVDPKTRQYRFVYDDDNTGEGYRRAKVLAHYQNDKDLPTDILGYNRDKGTVVVFQAFNDNDITANRLKLRDILIGMWKAEAGAPAKDLKTIRYENVDEASVLKAIDDAYAAMGKTKANPSTLTVRAGGTAPGEAAAFDKLLKENPFSAGTQKMIDEYAEMAGRRIVEFTAMRNMFGAITFISRLS